MLPKVGYNRSVRHIFHFGRGIWLRFLAISKDYLIFEGFHIDL